MKRALLLFFALVVLTACNSHENTPTQSRLQATVSRQPPTSKVVIFVIDGARYSETFGDTDHALIPHIWDDLRPLGAILTSFRNNGETVTVPGHAALCTGTWQSLANDGSERPDRPTLFEYYRQWYAAAASDAYVISGKPKLDVCAWGTDPDYGPAFGATADVGYGSDVAVYDRLLTVLQTQQPHLVMACFPQVDWAGHSGVWNDYTGAITGADSLVWKTWEYLQSDPYYAGQTYLFVTNDHGRHTDVNGGFTSHGDGCIGCRHLMFMALGPDIRANFASAGIFSQRDLARTVGQILDFPVNRADGTVILDIFQFSPTGIKQ